MHKLLRRVYSVNPLISFIFIWHSNPPEPILPFMTSYSNLIVAVPGFPSGRHICRWPGLPYSNDVAMTLQPRSNDVAISETFFDTSNVVMK